MKLKKDLEIIGKSLFITNKKILILSDLHIGQDESMNANGFLVPRFQYDDLFKETQQIIRKTKPKIIILNGDIKHEFSGILREEWKRVKEYIDYLQRKSEVILIKGNHDSILKPLAEKQGIQMVNHYLINNLFVCHGDKIIKNNDYKKSKTIIIGHEHPAVTLREGVRTEKYRCFLIGKYEDKELVVMPAMNPSSEGSDILNQKPLSPYLKGNKELKKFKVIIIEENQTYDFGKLEDLEE
ncbi:metallophosphoesterase [Candidatus Woesearchaeota archaeon]|nr:metallophosphoesterase [Candidatus Woesearchaeota archaeon]